MRKLIALLCCLIMLPVCCMASALENLEVPSAISALVEHRVLLADAGEDYTEYIVVFYTGESGVLKQINDECHFDKSAGYTVEALRGTDLSTVYPGIDTMDFADSLIEDKGTYISLRVRFSNLDYIGHLDAMKKNGLIIDDGYAFDANFIIENLISNGMKELSMTEYGGLGLDFTVK